MNVNRILMYISTVC